MVHQVNKLTLFMYNYYDKQKRACIASRKYKRMYTVLHIHGVTGFQCTLLSLGLYKDQQTFHTPEKKSSSETPQMSSPRIQDFFT